MYDPFSENSRGALIPELQAVLQLTDTLITLKLIVQATENKETY